MKKTLIFILNFNTPEITISLFDSLRQYENNSYVTYILDNGSDIDKRIQGNHVIQLDKNYYFGGALNIAFQYILKYNEYDSLLFLNSDLIIDNPDIFVNDLRQYLSNFTIISPAIQQPVGQCHWRQMHQWNSNNIREILWIDFQCPMIHRRFIEKVNQYDYLLRYGWGNDIYSGMICEENNWKIGVCDNISVLHLDGYTTKKYKHLPDISNYNYNAERNMFQYFTNIKKMNEFINYRAYAENYSFSFV
jgi:hypothetical protein